MGSTSDWDVMSDAAATLAQFGVEFEKRVVSAHRTPDLLVEYAKTAKSRGLEVIIAGAEAPEPEALRTCPAWWPV